MSKIKQGDYIYIDWNLIKVLNNYGITNGKEIMLFAKIISLSKKENACKASNDYLSDFFCTTDRNIRKYLQDLKEKGLIKVFEQKEGLKTTTRYIYPQYDKLKLTQEELFRCSNEGAEQNGQSTGTDVPKERNIHSEPAEQTDLLIIEDKRKEKNIIDNGADAPNEANASESSEENEHKKIDIFENNKITKEKMDLNYKDRSYQTIKTENKQYNQILNDLMYTLKNDISFEGYISAAKENRISRDYTCSYIYKYVCKKEQNKLYNKI